MFKHISEILRANQFIQPGLREAIISLLPGGKIEGNSYIALNPTRADKNLGSFRIDLATCRWIDFASSDRGGDIVSLCAYIKGLSQYQAAQYLLGMTGESCNCDNNFSEQVLYFKTIFPPKVPKVPKVIDLKDFASPKVHLKLPKVVKFDPADAINFVLKIWNECQTAYNSLVCEYLVSRGYTNQIPDSIRYHPKLYHSPTKAYYSAMVALITKSSDDSANANEIIGIHRTYLSLVKGKITKAPVLPDKMILGRAKGGAIQLVPGGRRLVITEGIETALSIMQATSLPIWAALSASNMQNIIVPSPDLTEEVIIAADNDEAGTRAAETLAARLLNEGYKVKVTMPPYKGSDFNDLLLGGSDEHRSS